ncbi:MAG TPA: GIY-YIG nuclease family protein [Candidatus Paceibacterota bacterium]|nr:GIY-YIG nuclease family protein [Candidatus Paceibacterota bacterium]
MYFVYILKLKNGEYYTGFTDNLKRRVQDHRYGKVITTRSQLPLQLVWYASFLSKKKALDFELYLKSSSGFAFRNKRFI